MSTVSYGGLTLCGWIRYVPADGEPYPCFYSVEGLKRGDVCDITDAGYGCDHKTKWHFQWFRSGKRLCASKDGYDSPEEALKAIAELKEKGV